mgnify:CR=1 FL=1
MPNKASSNIKIPNILRQCMENAKIKISNEKKNKWNHQEEKSADHQQCLEKL